MTGKRTERKEPPHDGKNEPIIIPVNGPEAEARPADGHDGEPEAAPVVEPGNAAEPDDREELKTHLQRLAAEFDNFRKRTEREMRTMREMGMAAAIGEMLPVADSFARSLATQANGEEARTWREGLEKIQRQMMEALEKMGLAEVPAERGDALDPNIHEVMLVQPVEDLDADRIVQTFQVGYRFKDRLLRPAKVIVAAASEKTTDRKAEDDHEG